MSVVVIGKNSFVARYLQTLPECSSWNFLSHEDALTHSDWLDRTRYVLNCSFSPHLYSNPYKEEEDIDTKLARKVKNNANISYIMMSSRAVYGDTEELVESLSPEPISNYGKSKLIIEKNIQDILGAKRVVILRCSNIFGQGCSPHTFFGWMSRDLVSKKTITLNMSGKTRKDFLPISYLGHILIRTVQAELTGVYNVGWGESVSCHTVAQWLVDGYGEGEVDDQGLGITGQFFMNTSSLHRALDLETQNDNLIQTACFSLGKSLRET